MKTFEKVRDVAFDDQWKEIPQNDDGEWDDEKRIWTILPVIEIDGEERTVPEPIVVDWKDTPDDVMEQVNAYLKEREIDLEFVLIDHGDDAYHFGVKTSPGGG